MSKLFTDDEFFTEVLRRLDLHGNNNWIDTFSGVKVYLANPAVDMIRLADIAHALSNLCRYNGHCKKFFNVAEHSILVAREVLRATGNIVLALAALLHDAPEAYLGDVTGPLKDLLIVYPILEARFEAVISERFGLKYPFNHRAIKRADYEVFFTEADHLFDHDYAVWNREGQRADVRIECWDPEKAEKRFLEMAAELGIAA